MNKILIWILPLLLCCQCTQEICHACFHGTCFSKRKLFEGKQFSGQIAVDRMDNVLHFHYKDYRSNDYTAILDLYSDSPKLEILPVDYSFARAINTKTGEVYFSGAKGIYVYNSVTKSTVPYMLFNTTISLMQFKDKLYYTEFRREGIYFVENNRADAMEALADYIVDDFVIDKFNNIYFISDYILFRYKKGEHKAKIFSNIPYSLTTDTKDNVYLIETTTRTLFKMDYVRDRITEVGIFGSGSVFNAVFDKYNNLIYCDAVEERIYMLLPTFSNCTIVKRKRKKENINVSKMMF
ncbi:unnamed protein product [Diatraea saccharalis]|uniref:Ommochrome-binding protein-like n=1 Tax=Diatraea saccharalis TaxID=40085 RepID=A0A9N9R5I1_9NEOP|nr:unnamed protein product [Diatraea saccharalis]